MRHLAFGAWLTAAVPACAETAIGSLSVSATVTARCSVAAEPLAFGALAPGETARQSGNLTVNCTQGAAYTVALDGGANGERRMAGPEGATLAYELYRDAGYSERWGSGASGTAGVGSGADQALRLYAATAASEAPAGSYSDTVTISVSY